jgi:hypothetical protein
MVAGHSVSRFAIGYKYLWRQSKNEIIQEVIRAVAAWSIALYHHAFLTVLSPPLYTKVMKLVIYLRTLPVLELPLLCVLHQGCPAGSGSVWTYIEFFRSMSVISLSSTFSSLKALNVTTGNMINLVMNRYSGDYFFPLPWKCELVGPHFLLWNRPACSISLPPHVQPLFDRSLLSYHTSTASGTRIEVAHTDIPSLITYMP